jgi:thermitase
MKSDKRKIIFKVKDDVSMAEVLPNAMLGREGGGIQIGRLYDVSNEVASFRENALAAEDVVSDDELFDKKIYPTKSEAEQNLFRTYYAEGTREETEELYETLKADENIEYVQFDEMNGLYSNPNDPLINQLWGITKIDCLAAWDISQGEDIVVAVIDSGVDYNHPDIRANMWRDAAGNHGRDFSDNDNDPLDYHGHGSHCAGTIAATINNAIGVVGVAPRAKIMAVKVFPHAFDSVCAAGIKYAVDNGARVINNSWGPDNGRKPSNPPVADMIRYANEKGCIVVCAAGNDNDNVKFYAPANHPDVISVASTDSDDARASSSNFGDSITIAAPGVNILSLQMNTNQYTLKSGTSMACPHVAGLVALLLSINRNLTLNQIKQIIRTNADPIQTDRPISSRRINAARSVNSIAANNNVNTSLKEGVI